MMSKSFKFKSLFKHFMVQRKLKDRLDFLCSYVMLCVKSQFIICSLLGFSSGFSVLLIMSTIPIWLYECGVSKTLLSVTAICYFPYAFKFLWAPFLDYKKLPFFTAWLGQLRGWAFVLQLLILIFIGLLGYLDPKKNLLLIFALAMIISFLSSSRDIVTDAYRIEVLSKSNQVAQGSAMYLFGYRIGFLFSSAGGLVLAEHLSWNYVFLILSMSQLIGIVTALCIKEPERINTKQNEHNLKTPSGCFNKLSYAQTIKYHFVNFICPTYKLIKQPIKEFISRKGWVIILIIIPFYKLGDNFVQYMSNSFFLDIGFTKTKLAFYVRTFGLIASIIGSLWGGLIVKKNGDLRTMFYYGIFHLLSFLLYSVQAVVGDYTPILLITIAVTHVSGGVVTTAVVSYISNLCHEKHRSTQYALFSSARSLDKCLPSMSGWMADSLTWPMYFVIAPLFSLPAIILIGVLLFSKKSITNNYHTFKKIKVL